MTFPDTLMFEPNVTEVPIFSVVIGTFGAMRVYVVENPLTVPSVNVATLAVPVKLLVKAPPPAKVFNVPVNVIAAEADVLILLHTPATIEREIPEFASNTTSIVLLGVDPLDAPPDVLDQPPAVLQFVSPGRA
jgi:hypothetical protein